MGYYETQTVDGKNGEEITGQILERDFEGKATRIVDQTGKEYERISYSDRTFVEK